MEHFQKSGPVLSSQPTALEEYGACLMDLQKPDDALPVFEQILTLLPNDPHARYNLAVVQFTAQHSADAINTLQPLLDQSAPRPRRSGPRVRGLRRNRRHAARRKSAAASNRRKSAESEVLR